MKLGGVRVLDYRQLRIRNSIESASAPSPWGLLKEHSMAHHQQPRGHKHSAAPRQTAASSSEGGAGVEWAPTARAAGRARSVGDACCRRWCLGADSCRGDRPTSCGGRRRANRRGHFRGGARAAGRRACGRRDAGARQDGWARGARRARRVAELEGRKVARHNHKANGEGNDGGVRREGILLSVTRNDSADGARGRVEDAYQQIPRDLKPSGEVRVRAGHIRGDERVGEAERAARRVRVHRHWIAHAGGQCGTRRARSRRHKS